MHFWTLYLRLNFFVSSGFLGIVVIKVFNVSL